MAGEYQLLDCWIVGSLDLWDGGGGGCCSLNAGLGLGGEDWGEAVVKEQTEVGYWICWIGLHCCYIACKT
jgi:hypothetical protein